MLLKDFLGYVGKALSYSVMTVSDYNQIITW